MTRLSVIICTHNPRADYLARVLRALADQTLAPTQWELLLIDNASEPALDPALLSWHPQARLIREEHLGLTPARLRGIEESAGDVLVYVDDDNLLDSKYLRTAVDLLQAHPFLGAIGPGVLEPEFAATPSREVRPYLGSLALRSAAAARWSSNPLERECVPWGAGLCVRRSVATAYRQLVDQLATHDLLDRQGPRLFGNGDVAFSWAAARIGQGFGVFPALRATHLIRADRLTKTYLLRLAHDSSLSNTVSDYVGLGVAPQDALGRSMVVIRLLLRGLRRGPFALRIGWAELRGARLARKLIRQRRLQPLPAKPRT
jgi:glycosyltransferase involved in cell wall biosynthesis